MGVHLQNGTTLLEFSADDVIGAIWSEIGRASAETEHECLLKRSCVRGSDLTARSLAYLLARLLPAEPVSFSGRNRI